MSTNESDDINDEAFISQIVSDIIEQVIAELNDDEDSDYTWSLDDVDTPTDSLYSFTDSPSSSESEHNEEEYLSLSQEGERFILRNL